MSVTGHRRLAGQLASDSDSEAESDSSTDIVESPAKNIIRAAGAAQHRPENALIIWSFASVLKDLMEPGAGQTGNGNTPAQQQSIDGTEEAAAASLAASLEPEMEEGEDTGHVCHLESEHEVMRGSVAAEDASEHLQQQKANAALMEMTV